VVIVGGWAHRLLRYHPLAQVVPHDPLLTLDTDIAIPVKLDTDVAIPATLEGSEQDLRGRLKASGFEEKFLGENQPPATHYELADEHGEFYAEFLSPLIGSEYDRDGNRRATTRVAGVTSQYLRYVDVLLNSPWTVQLSRENGFPFETPNQVRIAHPTRGIPLLGRALLVRLQLGIGQGGGALCQSVARIAIKSQSLLDFARYSPLSWVSTANPL
jgi:hypothetical protein